MGSALRKERQMAKAWMFRGIGISFFPWYRYWIRIPALQAMVFAWGRNFFAPKRT